MCRFLLSLIVCFLAVPTFAVEPAGDVGPVVVANTGFAVDLYRQLARENPGKNLFCSPYSVSSALAMTWEGARGETAGQMAAALKFAPRGGRPLDAADVHAALGRLNRTFNAPDRPYRLAVANALWGEKTFPFRGALLDALNEPYGAVLRDVDFIGQPEAARKTINGWVASSTEDRIRDLLPAGSIDGLTRLVLTNAIYFKGDWQEAFDRKHTQEADFTTGDGKKVKVPLMFRREALLPLAQLSADGEPLRGPSVRGRGDGAEGGFQLLELPYKGKSLSMLVLLPARGVALADLEEKLTAETLAASIDQLRPQKVNVFVPRMKMETRYDLIPTLQSLGIRNAFTRDADFTGLSDSPEARDLYVSGVFHKAFVEVNEEGTEAAAATGVVVGARSIRITPTFRADRPFLLLIRHQPSGTILFMGRCHDPRGGE